MAKEDAKRHMQICIALDTTGSMGPEVERCRLYITALIDMISKTYEGSAEVCILSYKDICDGADRIKISGFSKDGEILIKFVSTLHASGGGDYPEDVIGAFDEITRIEWSEHSDKLIVWIADAPPHGIEFGADSGKDNHPYYPLYDGGPTPDIVLTKLLSMNVRIFGLHVRRNLRCTMDAFARYGLIVSSQMLDMLEAWKTCYLITDSVCSINDGILVTSKKEEQKYMQEICDEPFTQAFCASKRNLSFETLAELLKPCWETSKDDTIRLVLYQRKRDGMVKEKELARKAWVLLRQQNPQYVSQYLKHYVTDAGCVTDLLRISDKILEMKIEPELQHTREIQFFAAALAKCYLDLPESDDVVHINVRKHLDRSILRTRGVESFNISPHLLAKWAPRERSKDKKYAVQLAQLLFLTPQDAAAINAKKYINDDIVRHYVLPFLRGKRKHHKHMLKLYRHLYSYITSHSSPPVEVLMCKNRWDEINLEKIPSQAMKKYKKAFSKRIPQEVKRVLEKKSVKATTLNGDQIVSHFVVKYLRHQVNEDEISSLDDCVAETQWENYILHQPDIKADITIQVDLSGSMVIGTPIPLVTAIHMLLLTTSRFITSHPRWVEVKGDTLEQKIGSILRAGASPSLDIVGGLQLAKQEKDIDTYFVLTDLRISGTNLKLISDVCGDTRVVIWNMNSSEKVSIQQPIYKMIKVISGTSPLFLKLFSQGDIAVQDYILKLIRDKFPLRDS